MRLVDSTRLRSANQIFQRRRLCDLPGFTSASFPQSYNSSTGAYNLGIRGMSDYVTGANTVTQAPGWSLARTVETTLDEVLSEWLGQRRAEIESLLA